MYKLPFSISIFCLLQTGVVYCFEQSSELQLRDTLDLHQPITSLAWTTQYDRLAVSTKEVVHMEGIPLNALSFCGSSTGNI